MAKIEEKNAARRAESREKILSAATVLFAQKGIAGTGVQEIADMADLSVGLLYRHFKAKEDIFVALAETSIADIKTFNEVLEKDIPPAVLLKALAASHIEHLKNDDKLGLFPKLFARVMEENLASLSHTKAALIELSRASLNAIVCLIEQGQADGSFRQGCAKAMAHLFQSTVLGLSVWKQGNEDWFVTPAPAMLTAFLLKDEYNVYEAEIKQAAAVKEE